MLDFLRKKSVVTVLIDAPLGLHLRPCAMVASIAKSSKAKTTIALDEKIADAKETTKILALGIEDKDIITITSVGEDSYIITQKIADFLSTLFEEPKVEEQQGEQVEPQKEIVTHMLYTKEVLPSDELPQTQENKEEAASSAIFDSTEDVVQDEIIEQQATKDNITDDIFPLEQVDKEQEHSDEDIQAVELPPESHKIAVTTISGGVGFGVPFVKQKKEYAIDKAKFSKAYKALLEELAVSEESIFGAQKALLEEFSAKSFDAFDKDVKDTIEALKGGQNEPKIADCNDLKTRILAKMSTQSDEVSYLDEDFIFVCDEILPSEVVTLSTTKVQGVVAKELPQRSHAAMLLRGYGIVAVVNKDDIEFTQALIVDGDNSCIFSSPTNEQIEDVRGKLQVKFAQTKIDNEQRFEKVATKDGKPIKIQANIGDLASAKEALECGCDGVGLFRTEFLFKEIQPSLAEQIDAYSEIFSLFDEITVRTLDVGGDKKLPYIELPDEKNPFLGVRGIRLLQTHQEIIKEQLLAILSAKRAGKLKVMFPMISSVEEFIEAKEVALQIAKENDLSLEGVSFGIMVEVPSVLFLMEEFNKVVDFYSIGTNDLSQYLFAIDRSHKSLTIDPNSNALYDALSLIVSKSSKPVSICGELASDENALKQLLDIGVDTLSVTPKMVPTIKSRIRNI